MKYLRQFIFINILLAVPLCTLMAQREVSYRIVLDDHQVPKEEKAGFKALYPETFMSIWYTSHITYWYETRTRIKELPERVVNGLRDSEFGEWIWSDHKERIEAMGVPGYIYRLQVTDKRQSYIIRLNDFGEIVQIKYD